MKLIQNFAKMVFLASVIQWLSACGGVSLGASGGSGGAGLSLGTSFSGSRQTAPGVLEYRDLVKSTVQENLRWIGEKPDRATAFGFRISNTGEVSDIDQRASSGSAAFDKAALEAVQNSSPLPPPPEIVRDSFSSVRITVDPPH